VTKDLPVSLLVSETVVEELGDAAEYAIDSLGEVEVKGKKEKLKVYGIAPRSYLSHGCIPSGSQRPHKLHPPGTCPTYTVMAATRRSNAIDSTNAL
jgi:hypothetical protein